MFFRLMLGSKMIYGFGDADKMREHIFDLMKKEGEDFYTKYELYYFESPASRYRIKLVSFLYSGTIEEDTA